MSSLDLESNRIYRIDDRAFAGLEGKYSIFDLTSFPPNPPTNSIIRFDEQKGDPL